MKFTIIPLLLASGCIFASASNQQAWKIPVSTKRLPNGLTVVVSEDHSNPTVGVSVVYRVGFRLEPKNRAGFAHLFEHMMFEGTPTSPKGTFSKVIQGGGGVMNGSTRYDYTNYEDRKFRSPILTRLIHSPSSTWVFLAPRGGLSG